MVELELGGEEKLNQKHIVKEKTLLLPLLYLWFFRLFQSLLDEPNPNSPANNQAAQLYQDNRREYEKKVRAIVEDSWINITK